MATDPVELIRTRQFQPPIAEDLPAVLARLAGLPPSLDVPYLTLSLDWRPDGAKPARRSGRGYVAQQGEEFLDGFGVHTPPHESLAADLARIGRYLDAELDPAAQGVVIVACSARDVFVPVPLGVPVASRIVTGPTPALRVLARIAADEPTYAVLLADQREARLSLITQAQRERSLEVAADDYPRKQQQGGWSQRRYQSRADERVEAFARTIAEETRRALGEAGVTMLILPGEEPMATAIKDALHESVRERVIGTVHLAVDAGGREVVEAAAPLVERAERERAAAAVAAVRDGLGPGGRSVAGAVDTLTALQAGQVLTLVMNDDFSAPGWADYGLPVYGAGPVPGQHPAGGDRSMIVAVALEEELVRLAIQTAAAIAIARTAVPVDADEAAGTPEAGQARPRSAAARQLDGLGGVGATLRFTLDAEQSTAEL